MQSGDQPRYVNPLDENQLYAKGAASWRMDLQTYNELKKIIKQASWKPDPNGMCEDTNAYVPDLPSGELTHKLKSDARRLLTRTLNDASLIPNLRMLGILTVGNVDLQNGALDPTWHHDGFSGRAKGHAGEFFLLVYFNAKEWDDKWGGHLQCGERNLVDNWPNSEFEPIDPIISFAPSERTAVLGWNANPRFVHRTAPMREKQDRITMIASVSLAKR